ncbi:DNA ligase D [Flavisphingomonas formosensis]|uniref:DNA ligase D n=1 Tax=Flavisphingomonas formosensis TaxID=861534 RepID=UPI0012F91AC5|nr:DNA ligase D [Sphingomonas formosensis]
MAARADPLATYNRKRDFKKTAEPKGVRGTESGHLFIVQKHDATRLHWDFRLEMDGVLKSWAVTRGPSLDPEDKRLAVRTEDHPMDYAMFEGTIPKGEYGGGTVMLWDKGTWEAVGGKDPTKTIEDGHVHVILHGERMKGEWLLVRMKPRPGEKRENWLLRKIDDRYAGASGGLVDTALTSVASGRSMAQIADGDDPVWHSDKAKAKADPEAANAPGRKPARRKPAKSGAKAAPPPAFRDVQLATLVDHVPPGSGWLHEVKYDGYRALIAVGGGTAKAYTRHGLDWSDRFAPVCRAMAALDIGPALIDGEVVAFDPNGKPSFSALQKALKDGGELHYFAFDMLEQDGEDLTRLPNADRKARLAALLEGREAASLIHYAEHLTSSGEEMLKRLCAEGYEGIVSKRADAPYRGARTRAWLKTKCINRQEFVILGYTKSDKAGRDLRSLLLGVNEGGTLRYAGRVGTGFDADMRDRLMAAMRALARKAAAAEVPRAAARGAQWIEPKLVAEVAFAEFTHDNVVRHASFLGLREDKGADEVVREKAAEPPAAKPADPGDPAKPFGIAISHPDRLIYPEAKLTKGDLAHYYAAMAEPMLRWLAGRPVSLVRCPQGRAKHCFFQKHDAGSFGGHVDHVPIREKNGKTEDYLVVNDGAGLLTCVQMGTIEFHGWGARADDVEHPDRLVFDLDPDVGLDFGDVRNAAAQLRDLLGEMGLVSFPMVSGGKGLHVVVPLDRAADWPRVKDFASRFSRAVAEAYPKRFTPNMRKTERKGRIFLDWLRNERGATAVLPYSARARETAAVAAPVTWDEAAKLDNAHPFTIRDDAELLKRAASKALAGWGEAEQTLPDF